MPMPRPRHAGGGDRPACGRAASSRQSTRRPTRRCATSSSRPAAVTRRVGVKGIAVPLTARDGRALRRARAAAHLGRAAAGRHVLCGGRGPVRAQGGAGDRRRRRRSIAKTFKLTPSELRVLLAIVEVGGVPEIGGGARHRRRRRSRRTCSACSTRPAPPARPISSSWSRDSPVRWLGEPSRALEENNRHRPIGGRGAASTSASSVYCA